jgi:AraC-like DNA-binding protein
VATLDMMLELISRFEGEALANEIANALVHTRRLAAVKQRTDGLIETEQSSLAGKLIALMEKNLDFPLSLPEIADELRIPARTLSHICNQVFGESPIFGIGCRRHGISCSMRNFRSKTCQMPVVSPIRRSFPGFFGLNSGKLRGNSARACGRARIWQSGRRSAA